jgi:hypothetical protein
MDRQRLHPFGSIGRLVDVLPLPLVENFPQRVRNSCIVLLARDFFLGRAIALDEVIVGDPVFFRVKFRERFCIGNSGVENDDLFAPVNCRRRMSSRDCLRA